MLSKEEETKGKKLEFKDYIAIVIAAFETTLLPIVIFLLVLFVLFLVLR